MKCVWSRMKPSGRVWSAPSIKERSAYICLLFRHTKQSRRLTLKQKSKGTIKGGWGEGEREEEDRVGWDSRGHSYFVANFCLCQSKTSIIDTPSTVSRWGAFPYPTSLQELSQIIGFLLKSSSRVFVFILYYTCIMGIVYEGLYYGRRSGIIKKRIKETRAVKSYFYEQVSGFMGHFDIGFVSWGLVKFPFVSRA